MTTSQNVDVVAAAEPLLINDDWNNGLDLEWSNHNDPQLKKQETTVNLNNPNVRLTIWALIYMILTTWGSFINSVVYMQFDTDSTTSTWDTSTTTTNKEEATFFSLVTSTNSIAWWGASILLCSLYCGCCKIKCNICFAILLIISGIMQFIAMFDGIINLCDDSDDSGWCRAGYVGVSIFFGIFSFYLAIDSLTFIGNNIKTRLIVKSILIAIRSLIIGAIYVHEVNQLDDSDSTSDWTPPDSEYYELRTMAGGNITAGIVCCIIVILCVGGFTCHKFVARLLSYFLITGQGVSLFVNMLYYSGVSLFTLYYVPAVVLIIYDLQYL